ncbi:GH92 family glycosyl hydrolase [uncultured Draconibacterium sp.]|uniref:GH92 family glycosyl hydrolase n=1 Tax=uncultured Draconibacterium sp. TaxID=1573823 RepID=UPI0025E62F0C|nr:GH92 family glycosyl hydrolase [uncultured Draconibacterium sp.]
MRTGKNLQTKVFGLIAILFFFAACEKSTEKEPVEKNLVDLVYPHLDSENSRWFFFSSACRPFGMVNLSPDTQIGGAWGSGYRYLTDTVKGFSHIHAWQLSGLSVMPVALTENNSETIFTDFYSHFSHETEKVQPGYHYLELDRYKITAEITSTKRVGFHKYKFNGEGKAALLLNLNTVLGPCTNENGQLSKTGDNTVVGEVTAGATIRRPKPTKVFFQIESDTKISSVENDEATGNFLVVFDEQADEVLLKAGISYTSIGNAGKNISAELPGWDFDQIVSDSQDEWNALLNRIQIEGGTEQQQRRFYTDLWHGLQGRRTISDASGAYPDYTGEEFRVGQLPLDENGNPKFNHYNSDAFWGAQWTINTLWGLVYPEIMDEFVQSMMVYYADGGLVPRGPSGGNYTYVMTGSSATPFIVSAIQKGIVTENLEEIYLALKKNHMPGGIMEKAGYEHKTNLGGGLKYYIEKGYVPHPIPEGKFGFHQDGASLTMEYAYQDWTLAQLAKKLGYTEDYKYFMARSKNYKNVYDSESTWMRPKDVNGNWRENFDPYEYENGFNESNGAQSTWFVPHDITGLAQLMGGKEKAVEKLNSQFETAEKLGFTSGGAHDQEQHPEYRRIPVNYGNQPSIQTGHVFNLLDRHDLSQYWIRKVVDKAFSGLSPAAGFNGDEDQGLMGSLSVLLKIGLFQMNGGTDENPEYQLGSPIFDKITIQLNPDYYTGKTFTITAKNNAAANVFVDKVLLNNKAVENFNISHREITGGGSLVLEMTSESTK